MVNDAVMVPSIIDLLGLDLIVIGFSFYSSSLVLGGDVDVEKRELQHLT